MGVRATEDVKFIIIFTVCFVIVGCIVIGAGYMIVESGILNSSPSDGTTPTVTPVPTNAPQGPTATPAPTAPIIISIKPTPVPTPVPSQYSVNVNYEGDASSRTYKIIYTLGKNAQGKLSDPIDMDLMRFSLWNTGSVRLEKTYSELKNTVAGWSGSDEDVMLEDGEAFVIQVSYYSLNILPDTESRVTFFIGDETVKTTTLPVLINPVITGDPPDPEATLPPTGS